MQVKLRAQLGAAEAKPQQKGDNSQRLVAGGAQSAPGLESVERGTCSSVAYSAYCLSTCTRACKRGAKAKVLSTSSQLTLN